MIHTAKNAIVFAVILLTVGISFGISQTDRDGGNANKNTFVCNKNKDKETREYQKNLKEQKRLGDIQTRLLSDPNVANDTCKKLKKKEQGKCQQDVAKLRDVTRDLVKTNQRISEYELCYLTPKCGSATKDVFIAPPSENLCASGSVVMGVTFDPTTLGSNGEGMWKWRCGIVGSSTGETCYAQSIMVYGWIIGEWGTCSNSIQYRTTQCIETYSGQPVDISYCGIPNESSRPCVVTSKTQMQSSLFENNPMDAANALANIGIIASHFDTPENYGLDEAITRQEYLKIMLTAMKLLPARGYQCQNIFSDISEPWVCAIAETALANGLISRQTNEQGKTLF
jgi:hypothetical protein